MRAADTQIHFTFLDRKFYGNTQGEGKTNRKVFLNQSPSSFHLPVSPTVRQTCVSSDSWRNDTYFIYVNHARETNYIYIGTLLQKKEERKPMKCKMEAT